MNSFIHLAQQMGLIDMSYFKNMPNGTKCKTIHDVHKSQMEKHHKVTVELNDIYGMLVLLGLGVGGAIITFIAEILLRAKLQKRRGRQKGASIFLQDIYYFAVAPKNVNHNRSRFLH